jgi:hypothetical protein
VEALAVMKQHGDGLPAFPTKQCVTLAKAGDMAGVARWQEINYRCDQAWHQNNCGTTGR